MSANTLKKKIRETVDTVIEVVTVDEWGVSIEVRSMSARARIELLKEAKAFDGKVDAAVLYPQIVIATAHDPETHEALFTVEDEDWLMEKSPSALDTLATAGLRVSRMLEGDDEAGKDGSSGTTKKTGSSSS